MIKTANTMMEANGVKPTKLRTDILCILVKAKKPLGAYEVLAKLKKIRPQAEPPTVYRVLDLLVSNHIIHRLDSNKKYVVCHLDQDKEHTVSVIFTCDQCNNTTELADNIIEKSFSKLASRHHLTIKCDTVELKGQCSNCAI